ncbi:CYFA0S03e02476g1_1 [Cyberlindnera fabianii]|uniref:ATP-dependent (S)-NAD(P)H-hydrate dehydratase n=1 Tax=Cyberlindnera fabianii TaxID=36022 RepID=A0A061AQC5_CYBFA|nr:CYFA0S03e02476g1_1 [Cyberlindnera fabianii]
MPQLNGKSTKQLLRFVQKIVPPLLPSLHKGQAGRIVVIGGCEDYTGAPYFSAHAAAIFGADLTHVICEYSAATVIKSYSPDLMVHPYMYDSSKLPSGANEDTFLKEKVVPKIESLLGRIHVAIVGPGFGRDTLMLKTLETVIQMIKDKDMPLILDADALYLVSQKPKVIEGYEKAIITPNVVEFARIAKALGVNTDTDDDVGVTVEVSKKLGVTVMRKGEHDLIVSGDIVLTSDVNGSLRRVGGQGDTLTGIIATLVAWGINYGKLEPSKKDIDLSLGEILSLCCLGASASTRYAARKAFEDKGRAMQASDVHSKVGLAYKHLMEDENLSHL